MKRGPSLNRRKMLRYVLQGVALGGIATALVLVFTVDERTLDQLRHFSPAYVPVLFGMVVLAWCCNGARVWLMCRAAGYRLRYRQAIAVSLSTEFGIAATPAGVGGTVIRLSLLRQAGVPLATAGSLLAADAAVDFTLFFLLAPFAIFLLLRDGVLARIFNESTELDALFAIATMLVIGVGGITLLRSDGFHRWLARLAGATEFGRRRRLAARHRHIRMAARRGLRRVSDSLAFLWRHRKGSLLLNFAIACVQWSCRYMLLPMILFSLGTRVNPVPLLFVQGVLFGLSLLVVAPGGGGAVEILTAIILPNLVPRGLVGVVLLVWRFFTYHLYVLGGGTMFFYVCQHWQRLFERTDAAPAAVSEPSAGPTV